MSDSVQRETPVTPKLNPDSAPSIDPAELPYYERLADSWWDTSGPFWPLHRLNALRADWLSERLLALLGSQGSSGAPLRGLRILDIGCGGGLLSESMARLGAQVTGVDVVEKNICIARLHATQSGLDIDYRVNGAEALAAQGEHFDAVLNMEVVEHVADVAAFMSTCAQLVRPGGAMAVATINRTLIGGLFAIIGAEHILRWLPKGTHQWRKFRRPREIEALLTLGGLRIEDRTGVRVNPLRRTLHLTAFEGVNYMLLARKAPHSTPLD